MAFGMIPFDMAFVPGGVGDGSKSYTTFMIAYALDI